MTQALFSKLVTDILDAQKEAEKFLTSDDGGTCNFDSATLLDMRLTELDVSNVKEATGVDLSRFRWYGKVAYWVGIGAGQGNRRSRMAEAAYKLLKERGWHCTMYYQMD